MNYLNLGCGRRYHPAWTNLNFFSSGQGVIAHDLTQGIPFPDASFDVVYHSHLLEHFAKPDAESFLKECCRVLRPQGVLRVVVPDLEQIVQLYLTALEQASSGSQAWALNYEWILLEMYDQTVRNYSGGEMAAYLAVQDIANKEFVLKRYGAEAKDLMEAGHQGHQSLSTKLIQKLRQNGQLKPLLQQFSRLLRHPTYLREPLLKLLLGKEYNALRVGRFRQGGEVHQWMYDRYSLATLFKKSGLENIVQRSAAESYVPEWASFNLDTEPDGTIFKPDSLYMEASKVG